jgi:hypothetical protein
MRDTCIYKTVFQEGEDTQGSTTSMTALQESWAHLPELLWLAGKGDFSAEWCHELQSYHRIIMASIHPGKP